MFIEKISKKGSFSTSAGNQVYDQSAYPSERAANGDVLATKTMIRNVLRSKISTLRQNTNNTSVKGETIQISPRDLSFDASELELTVGIGGPALAAVETAIEQASGLRKYFGDKLVELGTISKQFDFDYVNNLGAKPSAGDSILAVGEATGVMSEIIASDATLIDIQANVNSDVALWLLKT